MSTGRYSCGSLESSAQDNQADSDRECPAGWPQGSAGQASSGCWGRPPREKPCGQSLTCRCPQLAVTRERHRRERSTAAMAAWLHWLARSSGERRRPHQRRAPFDPRRRPATNRRQALPGNLAAAAGRPATRPAGQRRPTGGPEAAGSARQSRTAVRRPQTRRERGTDRWTAVPP